MKTHSSKNSKTQSPPGDDGKRTAASAMNRQEIEARIDKLEDLRFYLAMKDRWNSKDFEQDREWSNELFNLRKELKNA